MTPPAYSRLGVDERRRQLLATGAALFAEHAYEDISMREVADAAGVSKALLYHYFPSKTALFRAAVSEAASELAEQISPSGAGTPLEQLAVSLAAYLAWVEAHAQTWRQLMRSVGTVPEAADIVGGFREQTLQILLRELSPGAAPPPALRIAIRGWLGYLDEALLDWVEHRDVPRARLQELLVAAFAAALAAGS